jgi:hypothetical protein
MHLAVDDLFVAAPIDVTRLEAERADEELVGRLDVAIDEEGDDGRKIVHAWKILWARRPPLVTQCY